jgi:hypothetical protein
MGTLHDRHPRWSGAFNWKTVAMMAFALVLAVIAISIRSGVHGLAPAGELQTPASPREHSYEVIPEGRLAPETPVADSAPPLTGSAPVMAPPQATETVTEAKPQPQLTVDPPLAADGTTTGKSRFRISGGPEGVSVDQP